MLFLTVFHVNLLKSLPTRSPLWSAVESLTLLCPTPVWHWIYVNISFVIFLASFSVWTRYVICRTIAHHGRKYHAQICKIFCNLISCALFCIQLERLWLWASWWQSGFTLSLFSFYLCVGRRVLARNTACVIAQVKDPVCVVLTKVSRQSRLFQHQQSSCK
jgi:hypothetical protein